MKNISKPSTTLSEILEQTTSINPEKLAIVYGEKKLTWQQLSNWVFAQKLEFIQAGMKSGDQIGLLIEDSPEFVVGFFASVALGALATPLNPRMTSHEFQSLNLTLDAVFTSISMKSRSHHVCCNDSSQPKLIQCVDEPAQILATHGIDTETLVDASYVEAAEYVTNANLAAIQMFSSGTTGLPKTLIRTHQQCVAEIVQTNAALKINVNDCIFSAIPLYHAHGLANSVWAAVYSGACLVILSSPAPLALQGARIVRLLIKNQITVLPGIPILFELLSQQHVDASLLKLRLCFSAGMHLKPEVFSLFLERFEQPIRQLYGCTESGAVCFNQKSIDKSNYCLVGEPMSQTKIDICDDELNPLPIGHIGQIRVASPNLTIGYLGSASHNEKVFSKHGFLTGDLGKFNAKGQLEIISRAAYVFEIAGNKVYANEVENAILQHKDIEEVVVVYRNEKLIAYTVTTSSLDKSNLKSFCQQMLPAYKCPHRFELVPELPKTSNGKIRRDLLKPNSA